ncbi:MAG: hypothetical protein IJR68_06510 [Fretibacterium sp.]|nr:hypothetical protein [Fretibacterium sp.]
MSFTPGPWEVGGKEDGDLQIWPSAVFDDNTMPITIAVLPLDKYDMLKDWPEDGGPSEMMAANARLIAAAPEMKDLLEDAGYFMLYLIHDKETIDDEARAAFDVVLKIGALLRRIEGEEEN